MQPKKKTLLLPLLLLTLATHLTAQDNQPEFPPRMNNPKINLSPAKYANGTLRANEAANRVTPRLDKQLTDKNLQLGSPIFIRIFKESNELELWIKNQDRRYTLFKTYEIAAMSGNLGPKTKQGDYQAPEGFYYVPSRQLNPQSRFHLSFNLGYPNAYDRAHGYTGFALMVHGNRVSAGCFAMTDYYIEEIYTICAAALKAGQPFFRVHSFPFRLTEENLAQHKNSPHLPFWKNLQPGFNYFEKHKTPPNIIVQNKKYLIENNAD